MKLFFLMALAAVILSGCTKDNVNPQNDGTTSTGGGSSTPPGPVSNLSHDDSIHMAAFRIKPQVVNASVSGTNLILKYNENVDLFFAAEGYKKTYAVHLKEDFKNTMLAGFDFTTVAEGGNTTLNWVDDNLNNVILKTVTDTVINNVKVVKINVHRQFTFFKIYSSNQLAAAQRDVFVARTNDTIRFSSFSYYAEKKYPQVTSLATMVYKGSGGH
jgi:hypothetical protein